MEFYNEYSALERKTSATLRGVQVSAAPSVPTALAPLLAPTATTDAHATPVPTGTHAVNFSDSSAIPSHKPFSFSASSRMPFLGGVGSGFASPSAPTENEEADTRKKRRRFDE